jgi:hypothetical protein
MYSDYALGLTVKFASLIGLILYSAAFAVCVLLLPSNSERKAAVVRNLRRMFCALFVVYVLTYLVLTFNGGYQPISVGASHVKEYAWAPLGFYDPDHAWKNSSYAHHHPTEKTGGWNQMMLVFYPLWFIDVRYIHTESWMPPITAQPTPVGVFNLPGSRRLS